MEDAHDKEMSRSAVEFAEKGAFEEAAVAFAAAAAMAAPSAAVAALYEQVTGRGRQSAPPHQGRQFPDLRTPAVPATPCSKPSA